MAGVLVEPEPESISISTHTVLPPDEGNLHSSFQEKWTKYWQESVFADNPQTSVVKKRNRRRKKKCNQQSVNAPLGPSVTNKRYVKCVLSLFMQHKFASSKQLTNKNSH